MAGKTLCKVKGEKLARDPGAQREMILDPAYICEKCARVARREKYLCHAIPLAQAGAGTEPSRQREEGGKHQQERQRARKKDGKDRKDRKGKKRRKS
jgi:hypothetical protein